MDGIGCAIAMAVCPSWQDDSSQANFQRCHGFFTNQVLWQKRQAAQGQ
jgi:hypothetical protein